MFRNGSHRRATGHRYAVESDRFALAQGERAMQRVPGDLVLAQERHPAPAFGVAEELVPGPHHLRRTPDPFARPHRHHAAPVTRLLEDLLKAPLDLSRKLPRSS